MALEHSYFKTGKSVTDTEELLPYQLFQPTLTESIQE